MRKSSFRGTGTAAVMARGAGLVSLAALPFACAVYSPTDLRVWASEQAEAGSQGDAAAGAALTGGFMNGGGPSQAAGTTGVGASGGSGAPGTAGDGAAFPASPQAAGEGGAAPETGAGGLSAGGAGAGSGGTGAAGASGAGPGAAGAAGVPAVLGLVAAYPCEGANRAVLADTSGNGKHATLANGSGGNPVGFTFGNGMVGKALTLNPGNQAYVSLPKGIVATFSEVTIATWVKLKSGAAFQRIFDFGVDTETFMYLVNSGSNGSVRFRISSASLNKNQTLEGAEALPVGRWTHVTVTVGDNGAAIFLDGVQIAQKAPAALRPSDLGVTGNNFIGRSPFAADPYLDAQIDELRIYNRVLRADEIETLAQGL